jgi:peptide/nickel transport system substrate-binding protein
MPRLAQGWHWENDGLRLRLNLKEGVLVHDGTRLTAGAVATALRAAISRPGNQLQYPSFPNITGVEATTDDELVVELSRPSGFLPEDLELPLAIGAQGFGTGAFRIVKSDPGTIELERFEGYHLGPAQIERVTIRSLSTLRTAWTSLLRGEVGMVTNVPPDALEFVSTEDVQMFSFNRPFQYMLAFNSRRSPLDSARVRRALNFAVDRQQLIQQVFKGKAEPSTGPIWSRHWAYDNDVSGYTFDPDMAESLLNEAGLPRIERQDGRVDRFQITCLIPENFTLVERVALEVQRQLYNVGVNLQFEVLPIQEFDTRIREGRFEAMLIDAISGPSISRPHGFWRSARGFKGMNWFGYENPEAERLFNVLIETTNEAAVRSAIGRLQRVFIEDPPALFIAWNQSARAVRRQFQVVEEPGRDPLYTIWRWTPITENGRSSAAGD